MGLLLAAVAVFTYGGELSFDNAAWKTCIYKNGDKTLVVTVPKTVQCAIAVEVVDGPIDRPEDRKAPDVDGGASARGSDDGAGEQAVGSAGA